MDVALYFLEDMLHIVRYIFDTQVIPLHAVTDVVRQHQIPDMVPQTQAATLVPDDTSVRSSQHLAPGSRHSTEDSGIRVGDVYITTEGLDEFGEQLRGLSAIDASSSLGVSSYIDLLFGHGSTDSTPLPTWLHNPLHLDLLAFGHGAEGGSIGVKFLGSGALVDDMMEFADHPPSPETQVHI